MFKEPRRRFAARSAARPASSAAAAPEGDCGGNAVAGMHSERPVRGQERRACNRDRPARPQRLICGAGADGALSFADYKRYREAEQDLGDKLIGKALGGGKIRRAARLLGIWDKKGIAVRSNEEGESMIDFALHDLRDGRGRNAAQAYLEDVGAATDLEREMLEMRAGSRTSLFRAESCDPRGMTVELSDRLQGGRGRSITIYDSGLSATLRAGMHTFNRIYSGGGLRMTSGITFAFPGEAAPALIRRYRRMRERRGRRGPAARFALFFRMNRECGLPVHFAQAAHGEGGGPRGMPRAGRDAPAASYF